MGDEQGTGRDRVPLYRDDRGVIYYSSDGGRTGQVLRPGWEERWTVLARGMLVGLVVMMLPTIPLLLWSHDFAAAWAAALSLYMLLAPTLLLRVAFQRQTSLPPLYLLKPNPPWLFMLMFTRVWSVPLAGAAAKLVLMKQAGPWPVVGTWLFPLSVAVGIIGLFLFLYRVQRQFSVVRAE